METTVQINSSDNSEHISSQNKHGNEVNIKRDEMKIQTAEDSAIFETQSSQEPKNISEDNGASHQLEPHKEQYEPESIDSHGFINGNQNSEIDLTVLRKRELKWLHMLSNWDEFMVDKYNKVRSRCRKGIPPATRPEAWYYLCGAKYLMEDPNDEAKYRTNTKFEMLCNHTGENKWTDDIEKDLHRNFPNHELFGGAYKTIGQKELFLVLKAYSIYNPSVGYCQAQAPVAALLLMNLPTEKAFWCFVSICDKYLTGYYSSGMQAIQLDGDILFGLLKRVSPNAYKHLKKQSIEPILYMTEWFLCAFTRTLPWPTVLRIWDMFVCEGVKVLFKVGLVLLKNILTDTARKKCPSMYETLTLLKELPSDITNEAFLIPQVLQIDISEEVMAKEHRKQLDKRNKNNK